MTHSDELCSEQNVSDENLERDLIISADRNTENHEISDENSSASLELQNTKVSEQRARSQKT